MARIANNTDYDLTIDAKAEDRSAERASKVVFHSRLAAPIERDGPFGGRCGRPVRIPRRLYKAETRTSR